MRREAREWNENGKIKPGGGEDWATVETRSAMTSEHDFLAHRVTDCEDTTSETLATRLDTRHDAAALFHEVEGNERLLRRYVRCSLEKLSSISLETRSRRRHSPTTCSPLPSPRLSGHSRINNNFVFRVCPVSVLSEGVSDVFCYTDEETVY